MTDWQYDKPVVEGIYLVCRGDVEVVPNMDCYCITSESDDVIAFKNECYSIKHVNFDTVNSWHNSFKFKLIQKT